jgi:hypothetical protein
VNNGGIFDLVVVQNMSSRCPMMLKWWGESQLRVAERGRRRWIRLETVMRRFLVIVSPDNVH